MPQNGTVFEQGGGSAGPQGPAGTATELPVVKKLITESTVIDPYGSVTVARFLEINPTVSLEIGLFATLEVG